MVRLRRRASMKCSSRKNCNELLSKTDREFELPQRSAVPEGTAAAPPPSRPHRGRSLNEVQFPKELQHLFLSVFL